MHTLPRLMLVTDRHRMRPNFAAALRQALDSGARLIQLREKDLSDDELLKLAKEAADICRDYHATLVINGNPDIAHQSGAAGTHWPESQLQTERFNPNRYPNLLHGASIHTPENAARATGFNYLVYGSIYPTQTHPGASPAGLEGLKTAVKSTPLPLYAIGGITPSRVAACLAAGAHGIAVIGAVWSSNNLGTAVQLLLDAIS